MRSYTAEKLTKSTVLSLLTAAVRAPTAMHAEPWQFVIVQDAKLLKHLSDRVKATFAADTAQLHPDRFAQPDWNVFYDAGTLIVICAKAAGTFAVADCWLAAQNLMLTAHAMGLGSCVIGSAASVLNLADVKREIGIPADMTAVAPIIVGTPRSAAKPSARAEPKILAWMESPADAKTVRSGVHA